MFWAFMSMGHADWMALRFQYRPTLPMSLLGPLAALGTSFCWSFTSTFFALAGRRVGSMVVNRTRLILAVIFLMLTHWVMLGDLFPWRASPERWLWLGVSGIVGLVIGDALLFQSFVWLGPRLSMLIMSLAPVISTLLAWLLLGEHLGAWQLVAIVITVAGVSSVISDQGGNNAAIVSGKHYLIGILFGLGGALGQSLGLVAAKKGLSGDFSALSGTLIRMVVATIVLWGVTFLMRQGQETLRKLKSDGLAFRYLLAGAFFGPFLGVYLSLVAVQAVHVGVASTLMSLPPVFLLPISHFVFGERIGLRAVAGTLVAIIGVAMLLLM
jgi:drug/metabolite transporter (DMT)-like permease